MTVHLGGGVSLPAHQIIAIVDMRTAVFGGAQFLSTEASHTPYEHIGKGTPRSAVLADMDGENRIFLSPMRSVTLMHRANRAYF